jgi:hypothetical protein
MITISHVRQYINRAKSIAPAVDFDAISIGICKGGMTSNGRNCRGIYSIGKRITLTNQIGQKEGFAVFLHELGHHLTWLQLGTDVYKTCSEYQLEIFADMFAIEMADELAFEYERWLGRMIGRIPSEYSRQIPALID